MIKSALGILFLLGVQQCDGPTPPASQEDMTVAQPAGDLATGPAPMDLGAADLDPADLARGVDLGGSPVTIKVTIPKVADYAGVCTAPAVYPGRVVSNPPGIDCSSSTPMGCQATLPGPVQLTAIPGTGTTLKSWTGGCVGNPCTLTSGSYTVSPVFSATNYLLVSVLSVGGGGSVTVSPRGSSPSGTWTGTSCIGIPNSYCCGMHAPGTTVTITENSGGNIVFRGWGGACTGQGKVCTVTVNGVVDVSASLARQ